jgi:hypothetical protein
MIASNFVGAIAACAAAIALAQDMSANAVVAPFSAAKPGGALPRGWQPVKFGPLKHETEYKLVDDRGAVVLYAKADAAASGLVYPVNFDVTTAPRIEFRWKVSNLIEGADNRVASKEDSPVRVSLGFDGDKSKLTLGEKTAAAISRNATGREFPYAQIVYVWANSGPVGTIIANPHTRRVEMVVAASGGAEVGRWVTISRNVVDDFRKAFGEDPGPLTEVGILTDTDNTGASVEAWYGDIRFLPAK